MNEVSPAYAAASTLVAACRATATTASFCGDKTAYCTAATAANAAISRLNARFLWRQDRHNRHKIQIRHFLSALQRPFFTEVEA